MANLLRDSLLARASLLAAALALGLKCLPHDDDWRVPAWLHAHTWAVAIPLSLLLLAVDAVFIYPFYRSPLRHFGPVVRTSPFGLIAERPRGIGALRHIQAHPGAPYLLARNFLNQTFVVPLGPEALRDVLATNSYDFEKPSRLRAFLARAIGWGVLLAEGDDHRHQRRALNPAFNVKNIRALYPLMWAKSVIFADQMERACARDRVVDVQEWASKLTLDIIGHAALSRDLDSLRTDDPTARQLNDSFQALLEPSLQSVVYLILHVWLPLPLIDLLPLRTARIWRDAHRTLHAVCAAILAEKKSLASADKADPDESDIMTSIISSRQFSDDNLIAQMLTFLGAGHETTAGSITFAAHLLCDHPDIQTKLRNEIRAHLPSPAAADSTISYAALESLPYLNGVCEEVLRLLPSVPATIRQAVRDTTIAGLPIRKGTPVPIISYAINRNPAYWGPDADTMKPERWIETDERGVQRPNKSGGAVSNFCETTFLHGSRACIGRDFAKAEFRCALAVLFGRFRVAKKFPDEVIEFAGTVTLKSPSGMRVVLERVDGW